MLLYTVVNDMFWHCSVKLKFIAFMYSRRVVVYYIYESIPARCKFQVFPGNSSTRLRIRSSNLINNVMSFFLKYTRQRLICNTHTAKANSYHSLDLELNYGPVSTDYYKSISFFY